MSERPRVSPRLIGAAAVVIGILAVLFATGRLDANPPTLDWEGIEQRTRVSGEAALRFRAMDARPGLGKVTVAIDDGAPAPIAVTAGEVTEHVIDTTALADGPHTLTLQARDRSLMGNRSELLLTLVVDNTAPTLQVARDSLAVRQGDTACVVVRPGEELAALEAVFDDRSVPLYPVGDAGSRLYRGLFGIGVQAPPGPAAVQLVARDLAGNEARRDVELQVAEVAFPKGGYIALSQQQEADQKDRDKGAEANARRGAAYDVEAPEQRWDGAFARPAEGPVTSPFGKFRTYSTGQQRHHLGVDISNATGTPVVAPAAGVVTLAEELHVYGNAVILSHGHGVSSSYNHLATIEVEVGQPVRRGQRLGTMGSTGQSTGPHLHWGMVAGGVAVDPEQFTREAFDPAAYGDWF